MAKWNSRAVSPRAGRLFKRFGWISGGLAVLGVCLVIRSNWGPEPVKAGPKELPPVKGTAADVEQKPQLIAIVNGERLSRNDLAREALQHGGEEVLDSLINKWLITDQCQKKGITVSNDEVAAEIDRMAERFGMSRDKWLDLLKEERSITPAQYAQDIVWPSVALRKLASKQLEITEGEIQQAYETQFGRAVQMRLIVCGSLEKARKVHAEATQKPDDFPNLAKQYSEDVNSASAKGLVPPLRLHLGDPKLEQVVFAMQEGEISDVIAVGDQFLIVRCERQLPAQNVPMDQVRKPLVEACRDRKLRLVAGDVFKEIQGESHVENIFHDPARRREHPGLAAIVNGHKITVLDLAEECIERNGKQVLEGTINRRLLEQACKQRNVQVSPAEMDAEIARAAVSMGKTKPDGTADVEAWLQEVTVEQKTTLENYQHDVVWPTVALKKLVNGKVEVTEDDLRKGYEANYGPHVRCRAIVFNQARKAQEVWEMARSRPTIEFFSRLAEEYSVESSSRVLGGEIPPIQKHSAQPQLEKEAFSLQPGELSSVLQLDDKWVILMCEGLTKPVGVKFEEVRQEIYDDIYEKKLRLMMAREFTALQDAAQIDNFLAGTSSSPQRKSAAEWKEGTSISSANRPGTPAADK
jgi:parvulin-like peptidyl-prolyl isomerase